MRKRSRTGQPICGERLQHRGESTGGGFRPGPRLVMVGRGRGGETAATARPSRNPLDHVARIVHSEVDAGCRDASPERGEARARGQATPSSRAATVVKAREHGRMAARPRRSHGRRDHCTCAVGVGDVGPGAVDQLLATPCPRSHVVPAAGTRGLAWRGRPRTANVPAAAPAAYSDPSSVMPANARSASTPCPRFTAANRSASACAARIGGERDVPDAGGGGGDRHAPQQRAEPHAVVRASILRFCASTPWRSAYWAPPIAFNPAAPNPPNGPRNRYVTS